MSVYVVGNFIKIIQFITKQECHGGTRGTSAGLQKIISRLIDQFHQNLNDQAELKLRLCYLQLYLNNLNARPQMLFRDGLIVCAVVIVTPINLHL